MPEMSSSSIIAGEAFVPIGTSLAPLSKGLAQGASMLSGWAGKMASLYSVYKIIGFGKESMAEAANEEKALLMLRAALKATGDASDGTYDSLVRMTNEISRQTEYSEEALREAAILAMTLGNVKAEGIDPVVKAAIGWATIMKVNVIDAMRQMIQSLGEGRNSFIKWGIVLEEGTSRQEKLNTLVKAGLPGFELQKAAMSGIAGELDNQSKAWGDFKEQVGYGIAYTGSMNTLLGQMTGLLDGNSSSAMRLGGTLGTVFSSLVIGFKAIGLVLESALYAIFTPINFLIVGVEAVVGGIGALLSLIPGMGKIGEALNEWGTSMALAKLDKIGAMWGEVADDAGKLWQLSEDIGYARERGYEGVPSPAGPPVPFEQPEAAGAGYKTLPASAFADPNMAYLLQQIEQNTRVDPAARLQ